MPGTTCFGIVYIINYRIILLYLFMLWFLICFRLAARSTTVTWYECILHSVLLRSSLVARSCFDTFSFLHSPSLSSASPAIRSLIDDSKRFLLDFEVGTKHSLSGTLSRHMASPARWLRRLLTTE